jgi:hypothetical protein
MFVLLSMEGNLLLIEADLRERAGSSVGRAAAF